MGRGEGEKGGEIQGEGRAGRGEEAESEGGKEEENTMVPVFLDLKFFSGKGHKQIIFNHKR